MPDIRSSIVDLKKQARQMARSSDLTYCQALDALARQRGFTHWKAFQKAGKPEVAPAPSPAESLVYNLAWSCQALSTLNRPGFPSIEEAEAALAAPREPQDAWLRNVRAAAHKLVQGSAHIAHPALNALRTSLAAATDPLGYDLAQQAGGETSGNDLSHALAGGDEIARALRAGALHGALTDAEMTYDQRFSMVLAVIKGRAPSGSRKVHIQTASHIVTFLAHKALVDGDRRMEPKLWSGRPVCIEMIRDTVALIQSNHLTDGTHEGIRKAAMWSWFNDLSSLALELPYDEVNLNFVSQIFAAASALDPADQQLILDMVEGLAEPESTSLLARSDINPRQREEARVAFLKMIVERYMLRTGQHGSEFFELAEANLGVYLADHNIEFGDPSRPWSRDLANEIADADMEVWPQFA